MDICTVVHRNYELLELQKSHWQKLGDHRLLVCDNTLPNQRQKVELENYFTLEYLTPPVRPWGSDGESHGLALDLLVKKTESDIIGIVDSDFFWTNPNILDEVQRLFQSGIRCVGTELWYGDKPTAVNTRYPERAGWLAPCVFGMFIDRNLALSETFVTTRDEAKVSCETGWRMREKIAKENIPCHVYRGFKYPGIEACYFGTSDMPMGVHLLRGSSWRIEETNKIPALIEKGISAWLR